MFGFAWAMIGLFTGTIVLVLFVRGIVSAVHGLGLGQSAEDHILMGVIVVFVALSFLLTRALVRRLYRLSSVRARLLVLSTLMLPGALSMYAWSNPTRILSGLAGGGEATSVNMAGAEFIFGAYPDYDRLKQLKRQGVTTIISLQHPAVLVEVQGIEAEDENAKKLGLRMVHAPMLPWVSDNRAALAKVREIARTGRGMYYVHCGLGRDRVNVVKRVVEREAERRGVRLANASGLKDALHFKDRSVPFERGRPIQLADGTWLVPRPNPHELFGYFLQGTAGHVVLVLDTADASQRAWLEQARSEFSDYEIPFSEVPFRTADADKPRQVAALVEHVRQVPGPKTIVVSATPGGPGSTSWEIRTAQALTRAYSATASAPRSPDPRSSSRSAGNSGR